MAQDRYKYFRVEAREILDHLGQGALDLEKEAPAPDTVARLLRLAHTLKGAARVVKQREIADSAHALEDALALVRDAPGTPPRETIDRVLSIVDEIAVAVARLIPQAAVADAASPEPQDEPLPTFRPAMDDLDALLGGVFEAHVRLESLRPRLEQVERARHVATLVVDQLSRPGADADAHPAGAQSPIAKARSMAADLRSMFGTLQRDLSSSIDRLDSELRQVREAAERLRLAPAGAMFTLLERAARDAARALGKRVSFEASGGGVRVDSFVLAVVQGALLQIVRNAIAHGVETAAERLAAGKPADGRVTLTIMQRGRLVSFTCTDDGRGVDLEAVRRIAESKGIGLDASRPIEPEDVLRILLKGGISTSRSVTEVSGRGIGLDVVREAAERLRGEVTVRTDAGKGTTIELVVPLSVASFRALVVDAAGSPVAIPLDAVRGSVRVAPQDVVRTEQRESILFEGDVVTLVSLRRLMTASPELPAASGPGGQASAVIVQGRDGTAAFLVERVIDTAYIVVRPLPPLAPASPVVAGTTLDAAGNPLLVLDPDSLVAAAQQLGTVAAEPPQARRSVLVVDDSLTTRMLEQSILESAGYEVDLATSAEEALVKAHMAPYALFLVDVEMPGMDGFSFVERIRADPALRHVPSILVTSRNAPEDRQRGLDVGAQAYIVKSEFDQGLLLDRIRELVQ